MVALPALVAELQAFGRPKRKNLKNVENRKNRVEIGPSRGLVGQYRDDFTMES